jgi:hypothetical protein
VRVLQELEILARVSRYKSQGTTSKPLLRRLPRAEWKEIEAEGAITHPGAVAVLVIPPLNRDPVTGLRPKPWSSSSPPDTTPVIVPNNTRYPISVLYPTTSSQADSESLAEISKFQPQTKVPLYNCVSLFPLRSQRAALYYALKGLLQVHAHRTSCAPNNNIEVIGQSNEPDGAKLSHAYMLYSDGDSCLQADSVPLAIALWRLRMWEGEGWNDSRNSEGIFIRNPPGWDRNAE